MFLNIICFHFYRENLAIINIFIKESYTKRFRKTEKMSRISYIASSGGLLGLCMGFSFVSLAEIAYHCFLCIVLLFRRKRALFKKTQIRKAHMKNKQKHRGSRSSLSNISPTFSSLPPPPPPPPTASVPPIPVASAPPFPAVVASSAALPHPMNGGRPG